MEKTINTGGGGINVTTPLQMRGDQTELKILICVYTNSDVTIYDVYLGSVILQNKCIIYQI